MTFFDKELQPKARMTFAAGGTIVGTSEGWYNAADSLFDVIATLRGRTWYQRLRAKAREADFLRAVRKAAEASVEDALAPRAVAEDYLCGFLANEDVPFTDDDGNPLTPQRVVDQLVRCGLLERVEELGTNRVRFVDDPIAELLYAKSLVDQGGTKLQELRRRLERGGEDVGGLREALEQVEAPAV